MQPIFRNIAIIFLAFFILFSSNLHAASRAYVIKDIEIEDFLKNIIDPILIIAGIEPSSVQIYLVNDSSPNAFVYGGKNIFIHTGLITTAESYHEIAGVVAHEIGHITAGHLSKATSVYSNASTMVLLGLAAILLATPLLAKGGNGDLFELVGFFSYSAIRSTTGSLMAYSRGEESQADQIGAEYINQSNFSLKGFADFMTKLYNKENKAMYTLPAYAWQTTHPATLQRINFINEYIGSHPQHIKTNKNLSERFTRSKAKILAYSLSYKDTNNLYKGKTDLASQYAMAIAKYNRKDYKSAIDDFNHLLQKRNNDVYLLEFIGDIYFDTKQYKKAINSYKSIKYHKSNSDIIYFKLARSYYLDGNYIDSLNNVTTSLQLNNQNPGAWYLKASILGKLKRDAEADLATAEKFLLLQNYQRAGYFASRAKTGLNPNSENYINAQEIIEVSKKSIKD